MQSLVVTLSKSSLLLKQMNDILHTLPENDDPSNLVRACVAFTVIFIFAFWLWIIWRVGVKFVLHYCLYYGCGRYRNRFAKQEAIQRVMKGKEFEKLIQVEMMKLKKI
jgi:hypothetical protein